MLTLHAMEFHFDGFDSPNGTYVPDVVFDVLAPQLTEAELRVLLYIIRRTFGFKKIADAISLRQMTEGICTRDGKILDHGTGLSKSANARGIKGLIAKHVVLATRNRSAARGDEATTYTLHFKAPPVSSHETRGVSAKGNGGVLLEDTQHTVVQETEEQQHPVVVALRALKVKPEKARDLLARFAPDYIQQKIAFLAWKQKTAHHGQPISDPTAWLIRAIETDYQPPPAFASRHERQRIIAAKTDLLSTQKAHAERHTQDRHAQALARLATQYQTTQAERDRWIQVQMRLEHIVGAGAYSLWLAHTHVLSLSGTTATIAVPHRLMKAKITHRFVPDILTALQHTDNARTYTDVEIVVLDVLKEQTQHVCSESVQKPVLVE